MPLDALFLTALRGELSAQLAGCRVDKVQQPSRDTLVLHLRAPASQVQTVKALLRDFPSLRLIIRMHDDAAALEAAGRCEHALPCVSLSGLDRALAARGTAFIPYTSAATQPGELIGRWQNARAAIASSLTQALLPLARTGFAISSEDIEKHVTALMGGNVLALYE